MATVYGMSSLNIAATAAPDGIVGCFFDRDLIYARGGQVSVQNQGIKQSLVFVHNDLLHANVDDSPLADRAWVLQERLLAPRKLHFGVSQIFWECRTNYACETFPRELSEAFFTRYTLLPKQLRPTSPDLWTRIVSTYSRASLSHSSDKLVAISGIARNLQEQTGDDYLAGLWRKDILSQICWHTFPDPDSQGLRRSNIPSWSWAGVDGEINFKSDESSFFKPEPEIHYVKLDNVVVNLVQPAQSNQFGHINGGVLTILSRFLFHCTVTLEDEVAVGKIPFGGEIMWDHWEDNQRHSAETLSILLIGRWVSPDSDGPIPDFLGMCKTHGLLLKQTGKETGQYERVGLFEFIYTANTELHPLLKGLLRKNECEKQPPSLLDKTSYVSTEVDSEGTEWYKITIV